MKTNEATGSPFSQRGDSLGWLVAVLSEEMGEALHERLKPHGLTLVEWPTLFALWEQDGVTQTELSRSCQTRNYTTSRVLDRLERDGWVERREDPGSRRNRLVVLSASGRKRMKKLLWEAHAVNRLFLERLTESQARTLQRLLRRVLNSCSEC